VRVANGANQQEKVQFGKAPESADHFTATVLLVAIVIMMSHVNSPRVLIVQDIPMHSEE